MNTRTGFTANRRTFLLGTATTLFAPAIITGRAKANEQLVIRTPGGAYDDVKRTTVYDPFRQETGIEVLPVPATTAKLLAMAESGRVEIDIIDAGPDTLIQLQAKDIISALDFSKFTYTNPDDLDPLARGTHHVAVHFLAYVMTYNKETFPSGSEPKSWVEFWDTAKFPGARTLPGIATGNPNLEFALLADGVPVDQLYPLDIPRAFASMDRIKASVPKFWETGALSAQIMADREAVLGSLWNSRVQPAIDAGAPLAMQWNQNLILQQAVGIMRGSAKQEAALKFIDYSLNSDVQKRWVTGYACIPANTKAYDATPKSLIDPETNTPLTRSKGFASDNRWWAENRNAVSDAWAKWIL